jgi:hypothetical protein
MQNLNQDTDVIDLMQDLETEVSNAEISIKEIEKTVTEDDLKEKSVIGNLYDVLLTNKPNEVRNSLKKALKTGKNLVRGGKDAIVTIGNLKSEMQTLNNKIDGLQHENKEIKEQLIETKEQLTQNNKELSEIKQMMSLMLKNQMSEKKQSNSFTSFIGK